MQIWHYFNVESYSLINSYYEKLSNNNLFINLNLVKYICLVAS